jgi:EpsI family protein
LLALVLAWLAGEIAFVRVVTDIAVLLMVPVAILALCGPQWVRALAFPLAFLALAVPLDQPLAPILAEWTAEATVYLLKAVAIPVAREGAYFTIPSGRWVVADACGGVKYLTSCLIVAVLLAPALFSSARKRTAFILGALALAIVGNWLRAFLTVLGAHLSNNEILRDDHATFGWFVYGVLFVAYCLAWWRLRDANTDKNARLPAGPKPVPAASVCRSPAVAVAALAIALSGPLISSATSAQKGAQPLPNPRVPEAHGWVRASHSATEWSPELQNVAATTLESFQKDGRTVDLFIGMFNEEDWNAKLVNVNNRFVGPGTPWALASRSVATTHFAGRNLAATRALIEGPDSRIVAWQWYWVDGVSTGSGLEAKLAQLRSRFTKGGQKSAWISISVRADATPGSESTLQTFLAEMGPAIDQTLSAVYREKK